MLRTVSTSARIGERAVQKMNEMLWVYFAELANPQYFFVTKDLYDLETELTTHGCKRQTDSLHFTRRFEYPWAFLQIPEHSENHLDAGGGAATFQYLLAKFIPNVTNLEIDSMWREKVADVKRKTGLFSNLDVVVGDISDLYMFKDKCFTSTTCISVIEHGGQRKAEKMVDELLRVTDGPVLISIDVGDGEELMNINDVFSLSRRYGFNVPYLPSDVMNCQTAGGKAFKVACIRLEGKK